MLLRCKQGKPRNMTTTLCHVTEALSNVTLMTDIRIHLGRYGVGRAVGQPTVETKFKIIIIICCSFWEAINCYLKY